MTQNFIKIYMGNDLAFDRIDNDVLVGRSHLANRIELITPLGLTDGQIMQIYFQLANGQVTPKRTMIDTGSTETVDGDEWNVYRYDVPQSVLSAVSTNNSANLKVQFRQATIDDSGASPIAVAIKNSTLVQLALDAGFTPNAADEVVNIDEYDDLSNAIDLKLNKNFSTLTAKATPDDTDLFAIDEGSGVNKKVSVAQVIAKAQGEFADLDSRVTTIEGRVDQGVKTTDSPTFANVTVGTTLTLDGKNIAWNDVDGTFDIVLNGESLQVGQELHFYGKAVGAITKGDVVMFADQQGNHILFTKATGAALQAFPQAIMGVATTSMANNAFGYVSWFGKVKDLNPAIAVTEQWALGDILYVDVTTGQLSNVVPTAPDKVIQVAAVIHKNPAQFNDYDILVRPHFIEAALLNAQGVVDDEYLKGSLIVGVTFDSINNQLVVTNQAGTITNLDISKYLDDTNLARITSGVYVPETQVLRFTRDDATTFDVDASMFFDDTNLVTSVNGNTGAVTLAATDVGAEPAFTKNTAFNKNFGTTAGTVAEGNHTHTVSQITDLYDNVYSETEVDALIASGSTTIKEQRFIITNVDNGDGTFSYTWLGNARTGTLAAGVYTFTLEESVSYIQGQGRIQAYINNDLRYSNNDPEFTETSTTTFSIDYAFQVSDDINVVVYQGLDTVSIQVGADSITRVELSAAVEADIDAGLNHSQVTSGNPHQVTAAEVGALTQSDGDGRYAPIAHATSATTYGVATGTDYGHVRVPLASSTATGALYFSGVSATAGALNGSTTNPTNTTRLNYEGHLYATKLYSGANEVLTSLALDGLSDVDVSGVTDGQALVYDDATQTWVPGEGGGGASVTISETAPADPAEGDLWYDSTLSTLFIYYNDGTSAQWVEVTYQQDYAEVANYTTTIAAADSWTDQTGYFTLAKTVTGITADDKPIADLDLSAATVSNVTDIIAAWSNVYRVVTSANTITFYSLTDPTFPEDTVVNFQVVR